MILPRFSDDSLRIRLEKLESSKRLAFGVVCCERLLPNYRAFESECNTGDIRPLRDSIDFIWRCLELDERENYKTKEHLGQCELVIPDSDNFQSKNVSYAQDAGLAVCNALDYLLSESVHHIVWIGTHATDSVDLYIQESENINPNDPELETKVLCHRLMQRELAEQVRNLNEIQDAVVPFSRDFLLELRNSWQNSGRSNLDLP